MSNKGLNLPRHKGSYTHDYDPLSLKMHKANHMYPTAICMLCRPQEEDCEHLFFKCPIATRIWASQGLSAITSGSIFWATLPRRRRGHEADRGKRFAVLWAIWLHRNEVMFEGKAVSSEGVIQEVERLVGLWFVNV